MDCAQTREALHGYLDRELDALTARALEEHLQSCAGCKQAYETQASLHAAIARHATYHAAADSLARRVRAATGAVATLPDVAPTLEGGGIATSFGLRPVSGATDISWSGSRP